MIQVDPSQYAVIREWFVPEQPTWLVGMHIINTGNGAFFVDRWPNPRAVLADVAGNYTLMGDPAVLDPEDLSERIAGFVDAARAFAPLLRETFPGLVLWERVIYRLSLRPHFSVPDGYAVRRLVSTDAHHLWGVTAESGWISKTWGGPAGLAASGYAWGAFAAARLVSVACTFFLGEGHEELGAVTEPGFRGLGLSVACAGALCQDVQARGRTPSWSTSPDNIASVRVAEKLGFSLVRRSRLHVIGVSVPTPPDRETSV